MVDMETLWQFHCCWGAIDGCHVSIQCPPEGPNASKEYHNFKNFYSIIMMAIVGAKDRFIWANVGFPGNSHDSVILQSTELWHEVTENNVITSMAKTIEGTEVYPMILGDSAFPFRIWLMKPYTHANLKPVEANFNYHLSRARMVIERAFGQLKISNQNICIAANESLPPQLDLTTHPIEIPSTFLVDTKPKADRM